MEELEDIFEGQRWPAKLEAHVVEPGASPRIHGYDVHQDLAAHYELSDVAYLALTGELPNDKAARAIRAALVFASPSFVHHAPAHAATLAHRSGAAPSAVIAVAATALAEQARHALDAHSLLFDWFETGSKAPLQKELLATDDASRHATLALTAAAGPGPWAAYLADSAGSPLSPTAAVLSILFHAGLKTRAQLETALVVSRLSVASAEAFAAPLGKVRDYPQRLPDFEYEDP